LLPQQWFSRMMNADQSIFMLFQDELGYSISDTVAFISHHCDVTKLFITPTKFPQFFTII